jgi:flagellar biosynthesis/type III secretory pathway chaperone
MSIQALTDAMENLIRIHDSLLELAKQKTQVLVQNDVDQLNRIVNKESVLVRQIMELDRERVEAIDAFLAEKCYKPIPNITISELAKLIFKAEDKQRLSDKQKALLERVDRLREHNTLNQQLIEQSLAFIDYTLDLIIGSPEEEAIYGNPAGRSPSIRRPGIFDSRA